MARRFESHDPISLIARTLARAFRLDDHPFEEEPDDDDIPPGAFRGSWVHLRPSPAGLDRLARLRAEVSAPHKAEALLATLSGEALLLLRLFCEIGAIIPLSFASEEARLLLGPDLGRQAFIELQEHWLVLAERSPTGEEIAGLPREVAALLLPRLPLLDEPQAGPDLAPQFPEDIQRTPADLALLMAAIWTVRPKRKQTGEVYKKDADRLRVLLGKGFPLDLRLGQLRDLDLERGREFLTVSPRAAERLAALRPEDALRKAAGLIFTGPRARVLTLLRLSAGQERSWFHTAALLRQVRIGHLQTPLYQHHHAGLVQAAATEVSELLKFPGLQVLRKEHLVRLIPSLFDQSGQSGPAGAATPALARIHVQPSFEVLVPPEAPPGAILAIGRVAELQKVDQVATFVVNQKSVARAVEAGLSGKEVVQALAQHAASPVPQNVSASIHGWVDQAGQARFAEGLVLVLTDKAERLAQADVQLRGLLERRIGPGVYLVLEDNRPIIEKRLKALDLPPDETIARLAWEREEVVVSPAPPDPQGLLPSVPEGTLYRQVALVREQAGRAARESAPSPRPILEIVRRTPHKSTARPGPPLMAPPPPMSFTEKVPVRGYRSATTPPPSYPTQPPQPPVRYGPAKTYAPTTVPTQPPMRSGPSPATTVPSLPPPLPRERDADSVPAHLDSRAVSGAELEALLRAAIQGRRRVYLYLGHSEGPWAVVPQRITHRGPEVYLEAYRESVKQHRLVPLSHILEIAVDPARR